MLVRFALSTFTPTVEDNVQLLAPRARVNPVGADPYFDKFPSALVAASVPVPDVVPPALSIVSEIELSTVPVTVKVPLDVAANELHTTSSENRATKNKFLFKCVLRCGAEMIP